MQTQESAGEGDREKGPRTRPVSNWKPIPTITIVVVHRAQSSISHKVARGLGSGRYPPASAASSALLLTVDDSCFASNLTDSSSVGRQATTDRCDICTCWSSVL